MVNEQTNAKPEKIVIDTSLFDGGETAWCLGCGNFRILDAVKQAMVKAGKRPDEILIVSGIGQAPKLPHYMKCNMFDGLHGRVLPVATGAKLANPELDVIGVSGDGDAYAEGGNHFLHAVRRNIGITYIVHDNQVYGLTRGQTSPTSMPGFITNTTPHGAYAEMFNGPLIAISMRANFVARAFAGDVDHLRDLIVRALNKPGFALIDILQPCVSFNKVNTFKWYKDRVYKLDDASQNPDSKGNGDGKSDAYDPTDWSAAMLKASEWGDKIPIGVLYENNRPAYESLLPPLKDSPPIPHRKLIPSMAGELMGRFY
jgi:2-oxoglutarate/2-oxoacid ferredoxin oxidoreductase subunit beta